LTNMKQLLLYSNNITCFESGLSLNPTACDLLPNNFSCIEDGMCNWIGLNSTWNSSTCQFPCLHITLPSPPLISPSQTPASPMIPSISPTLTPTNTNATTIFQQQLNDGFAVVTNATFILGNVEIPFNSTLEILTHSYLNISGCITLNGSLDINVQGKQLSKTQNLQVIMANCFIGSFQKVTITNVTNCQNLSVVSSSIVENILVVFIAAHSICGAKNISVVIGSVFGSVIGIILIITILLLLIPSLRYKILPASQKKIDNEMTLS